MQRFDSCTAKKEIKKYQNKKFVLFINHANLHPRYIGVTVSR